MAELNGFDVLTESECLRLLGSVPVGRLVFHERGLPAIRLVNFVVADSAVVFRSSRGQKYGAAVRGDVVAFEVDEFDLDRHLGWTVTVIGHAWTVLDPAELERLERLPLRPWAAGSRPYLVRIDIETINGRRLVPWGARRRPVLGEH